MIVPASRVRSARGAAAVRRGRTSAGTGLPRTVLVARCQEVGDAMPSGQEAAPTSRAPAMLGAAATQLRSAAVELRGLAATASELLGPVLDLDTPETWSSPWQRRATTRVDGWLRALRAGDEAMTARARWYLAVANAFDAAGGPSAAPAAAGGLGRAGGLGGEGFPGGGAGRGAGAEAGPVPRPPAAPAGWDVPDPALLSELAAGSDHSGPPDAFLAGPLGPGGDQRDAPEPQSGGAWAARAWSGSTGALGGWEADVWAGAAAATGAAAGGVHGGDAGGGGPVTFDPGRLGALAHRLRAAGRAAADVAAAVGRTDEAALDAIVAALSRAAVATGGGLGGVVGPAATARPPSPVRLAGLPGTTDVLRLGPHAIAIGGPDLAAAIERRTAHLVAAEEAVRTGGVLIDPRAWFDDAPPPTLAGIGTATVELIALIEIGPGALSAADVREIGRRLAALPPAAREAVISRLRGRPLRTLMAALDRVARHPSARSDAELEALAAVPDLLLASAPTAMVAEIVRLLPSLEPGPPGAGAGADSGAGGGGGEVAEANRADPVVRDGISTSDVGQGGLGDCYLAAPLIGLARQRPDLLVAGIRENPNGTFTVLFHRDGRPFPVTVTRALAGLPVGDAAGDGAGGEAGGGAVGGARSAPTIAAFDLAGRPELWAAV